MSNIKEKKKLRSPVAKHMNTFNKPATHVNKKKKDKTRLELLEEYAQELEQLKSEGKI